MTLPLTVNEIFKMVLVAAHLNALRSHPGGDSVVYGSLPLPPPPGISVLASTRSETNENNEHSQTTVSQKGFSSR